jgi:hypothetical protein
MNFVKSRAWLCLAICFQAALLARGQDVITDSATSDKLAISPANPRLEFPLLDMHLSPHANRARLTGWLKNSQAFVGEDQITVALGMSLADANCH